MEAPHQLRIAAADRLEIGIFTEAKDAQRTLLVAREARRAFVMLTPKPARDRFQRIGKVAPRWRGVVTGMRKGARRPIPSRDRRLGFSDLVRAHAFEEIVFRIVLADVLQAEKSP